MTAGVMVRFIAGLLFLSLGASPVVAQTTAGKMG